MVVVEVIGEAVDFVVESCAKKSVGSTKKMSQGE